jgi:uridine kinase
MKSITEIVREIEGSAAPDGMVTRVIAVDGPGGAGKSTLAARLAAALGNAPVIPTDHFASWDNPLDWWPRLIEQVLEPLSANQAARYQRYDWETRKLGEWREVAPADFLVLEGVSASREAFRPYLAYRIWV